MSLPRRHFLASSLAFAVGACASSTSGSKQQVTFWTMQLKPTFDNYMTDLIAAFGQQNPGASVNWVDVPWGDMENKILAAIAANQGPDVVNLNPQFATKLADNKALVELDPLISATQKAEYYPNLWKANQLGSVTFGLPWYVTTDITVYNRKLFTQAGLDPDQPPKTYAELAKTAATLKAKTGKYAFLLTMDGGQVLESMIQMGLVLLTPEGKAGFDTPLGRQAFAYWVELFKQKLIPREILTESHRRAVELYQAGELGLLLTGPQFLNQIEENAPDIAKISDVSSQMSGSDGRKSASVMNVVVSKKAQNADLALKFALFITNSQNQLAFSRLANILPSTLSSAKDPYFTTTATPLDRARKVSASQLAQSEVLIPPIAGLDDLQKAIYEELQKAMLAEKSVDQAVTDAANRWNARS